MLTYRDLNGVMSKPCPRPGIHTHGVMIMRLQRKFVDLCMVVYF